MYNPAVYPCGSEAYNRLEKVANIINELTGKNFKVETIYFDLGANWKWTTICGGYQVLNPREQGTILNGTKLEIAQVIYEITCKINERGW